MIITVQKGLLFSIKNEQAEKNSEFSVLRFFASIWKQELMKARKSIRFENIQYQKDLLKYVIKINIPKKRRGLLAHRSVTFEFKLV